MQISTLTECNHQSIVEPSDSCNEAPTQFANLRGLAFAACTQCVSDSRHQHFYTESMFFRRQRPKVPTFQERINLLKQAGFALQNLPDGRVKVTKHGVGAIIGDEGKNQPEIEKAGVLIGGEIATLLNSGYQMFLEIPGGKRFPAQADQLKAVHQFEDDVKDALGLVNLYNTSLGTTTPKHMYDRVVERDSGHQPKPWAKKDHRTVAPYTKDSSATLSQS
jgi:hypothetical protein